MQFDAAHTERPPNIAIGEPCLIRTTASYWYCAPREISLILTLVQQLWRSSTQCSAQRAQISRRVHLGGPRTFVRQV